MISQLSLLVLVLLFSLGHCLVPVNVQIRRYATSQRIYSTAVATAAAMPITGKVGHLLDVGEALHAPLDVILKAKRLRMFRGSLKDIPARAKEFFPKFFAIIQPMDILGFTVSLFLYKPLLKLCHFVCGKISTDKEPTAYEKSLFGRCEGSVLWLLALIPYVYIIDLLSIAMHTLGFEFHIKGGVTLIVKPSHIEPSHIEPSLIRSLSRSLLLILSLTDTHLLPHLPLPLTHLLTDSLTQPFTHPVLHSIVSILLYTHPSLRRYPPSTRHHLRSICRWLFHRQH